MTKENDNAVVEKARDDRWLEELDDELPEEIAAGKSDGKLAENHRSKKIKLGVRRWPDGREAHFKVGITESLEEVIIKGAEALGEALLPPAPQASLDQLRYLKKHGEWSEPLTNLQQPLWLALAHGVTRHLGIEYKLVVKINTRWDIAPSADATPRELLSSFGFKPEEFSLYTVEGVDPLPPDTALSLERGDCFEAQKDGKYGAPSRVSRLPRGSQTIEDDVEAATEAGIDARLLSVGNQKYVEVLKIGVPSPPWGKEEASILIAVPATYPSGGLDAFYLELPFTHSSGSIPKQQQIVTIDGRRCSLISWHYHESRPWNPLQDDLTTHVQHCRGFFLMRGIRQ